MPELPEVETVINAVAKAIGFSNIINVIINNNRFREKKPDDFIKKIKGSNIVSYKRIAKYIIIGLDNGLSIIWHLGMSGKIKICESIDENPEKHDHVIIQTEKFYLIFNDVRRFGLITYCESDKILEHHLLKQIGKDPFDLDLSAKYLFEKLQKKKIAIKPALLDQSIINGIGNIYASEILYLARISPFRMASLICLQECQTLIEITRDVLQNAINAGGSTIHDYKKPDGSLGYFQNMHCVYNKTGQRCPNCICDTALTGGIKKSVMGGRSTFYCERLQK